MPLLKPSLSLHAQSAGSTTRASARAALAARSSRHHPPFPVISTCPAPSCPCSATPDGLEIDQKQNLNGSMSPYAQHLVISTGRSDWTSKIEDEKDTAVWGKFTAEMKALLGRRGEFHDPFNNILITTSSFTPLEQEPPPSTQNGRSPISGSEDPGRVDALLFPSFQHIRHLTPSGALSSADGADGSSIQNFIRSSLLPEELHPIYKDIPDAERRAKTRDTRAGAAAHIHRRTIDNPTILICSHGQRDSRCGVLGPLLHTEFTRYINEIRPRSSEGVNLAVPESGIFVPSSAALEDDDEHTGTDTDTGTVNVNVGMISHVGGHKWAGNVIVYIPPPRKSFSFSHALAGCGIWYGRVEPRHVQGIVEQTLLRGKVIRDLFRGGISPAGEILRL